MIRQDYIMRMIEQLVKVLSKILFNKEAGDYKSAIKNIDNAFNTIVDIDFKLIDKFSAKDIKSLFEMARDSSTIGIKCIVSAKLIKEKTDILKLNNGDDSKPAIGYQKSLSLYLDGILSSRNIEIDMRDYYQDVNEIVKILADEITPDVRFKLFKFYVLSGKNEKAKTELSKLRELDYPNIEKEESSLYNKETKNL